MGCAPCNMCPYYANNSGSCGKNKNRDALAYIEQLEAEIAQLKEGKR